MKRQIALAALCLLLSACDPNANSAPDGVSPDAVRPGVVGPTATPTRTPGIAYPDPLRTPGDVFPVVDDDREGGQHGGFAGVRQQCVLDAEPRRQAAQHGLALRGGVELRAEDASHGCLRFVSLV